MNDEMLRDYALLVLKWRQLRNNIATTTIDAFRLEQKLMLMEGMIVKMEVKLLTTENAKS